MRDSLTRGSRRTNRKSVHLNWAHHPAGNGSEPKTRSPEPSCPGLDAATRQGNKLRAEPRVIAELHAAGFRSFRRRRKLHIDRAGRASPKHRADRACSGTKREITADAQAREDKKAEGQKVF